ncbi:MAG: amidohydrolase family protein, partial [Anaerolineales bacterium]|nr:amidohydrolase family protein [Anaerolineales bacterium]
MFDLIIRNGTVIDGTRGARRRADVGVIGDRIVAVGGLETAVSHHTIDATNQIVAPGFIDVHTHSDAWLLKETNFFSKTSQGFTTEIIGLDGISYFPVNSDTIHDWVYYLSALNGLRLEEYSGWQSLGDYMALLDGRTAQNVATFVPYANVRTLAAGFSPASLNDYQLRDIQRIIGEGMAEGAAGLSNGLDYVAECFASTDEFVQACQPLVAQQGVYVTHVRYKHGTLAGVQEAVEIGKRAGVPVHISHLKGTTPAEAEAILSYMDNVAVNEVDFSFDVYPYVSSSTMLNYMLPYEVWHEGPLGVLPKLKSKALRQQWGRNLAHEPLDKIFIGWVPGKENGRYQGHTLAEYI